MKRIVLIALLLTLEACGGGSNGSSAPTVKQNPAAKQAASAALLTIADFPAGWNTSTDAGGADAKKFDDAVAKCADISPTLLGAPGAMGGEADSPDFNSPDDTSAIASESVVIDTSAQIDKGFAALRSSKVTGCFDSLLGPYLKTEIAKDPTTKGATVGDVTTGDLSFPTIGQDTIAQSYSVGLTIKGESATVYIDQVYIRYNNAVAELSFQDVLSPFDTDTAESIARKAYSKLSSTTIPGS